MPDGSADLLAARRLETDRRLAAIKEKLNAAGAEELLSRHACVYATGSIGRGESSRHSDLDVFIVSDVDGGPPDANGRHFEEVVDLLRIAAADLGFPPFSRAGEYLKIHPLHELIGHLGTREDDHTNVFTARMLLLLESRPVVGESVYCRAIEAVVGTYWKDYVTNERKFIPVFLTNDVMRYWKVLCLSYEAHGDDTPEERRLRNYKLKYSRLLTCYSAILYLAWVLRARDTVTPEDAIAMTRLTPTQRLEYIREQDPVHAPQARLLLSMYSTFLATVDAAKPDLLHRFQDSSYHAQRRAEARAFGDAIFRLLTQLAGDTDLLRFLLV